MKINIQNYETYFLLYIDNELSIEDRKEVELFILQDAKYAAELSMLSQTVLEPVDIEYEDKALLYRFEEMEASLPTTIKQNLYRSETPVVKGYFSKPRMRAIAAVAAMLLLFVGYQFVTNNTTLDKNAIAADSNNNKAFTEEATANTSAPSKEINAVKIKEAAANSESSNYQFAAITTTQKNNGVVAVLNEPILPIATTKNQPAIVINEAVAENHSSEIQNTETIASAQPAIEHASTNETLHNAEATETFENINTDNPDRVIYIANLEIDGDKLRGFTRRVNALLKRNKTEKEK